MTDTATAIMNDILLAACPPTEESFRAMCRAHDLTYSYSDDGRAHRAGRESIARITAAAKYLPAGVAARVWNSVVDEKMVAEIRRDFYWQPT